jgi:hypothetical protein
LVSSSIPTIHLDVDTYAYTKRRIRWAMLFDLNALCHAGYVKRFEDCGPRAFALPHAVNRIFFDQPELPREFEVGWVGQTGGVVYKKRAEWLGKLASVFHMNDWRREYSLEELAEAYRRSRVVVNFGRDDFPQDANMRTFEVLASGALLITSLPSELTDLGFEPGTHFAGYKRDEEILPMVRHFLDDEASRLRIAQAARTKALAEHTYDCRAERLLQELHQLGTQRPAPARQWPEFRVRLTYLDFFSAHGLALCSGKQYRQVIGHGFRETMEGGALLAKAWLRNLRMRRWGMSS